jgi:O-antigen ligase
MRVSAALWIPLIWMIYSAARPISFWISPTSAQTLDTVSFMEGSPVDRNILSFLIIISIYVLLKRKIKWGSIFKNNWLIALWFLYCGMSIFWSDFPNSSLKRWVKEIGLVLSILIVLTETEPVEAVKILFKRFAYVLVPFSVLLIIYFPDIGISAYFDPRSMLETISYAGVSWNKNGLGRICMVCGFFFFFNLLASRSMEKQKDDKEKVFIQFLFIILIFYLLSILDSATSLGSLIVGIIVYLMLGTGLIKRNAKYLGVFIILSIVLGVILQVTFDIIGMFVTFTGRDVTLTGRTRIWKELLAFRTDPLIGVGYGSFWLGKRLQILSDIYGLLNESHNGYLNVYLELGMIGLGLLAGVIFGAYRNIKRALLDNYDFGRFRLSMFVIALVYNITEDALGKMILMWFVFLLVSVDIPRNAILHYSGRGTSFAGGSLSVQ